MSDGMSEGARYARQAAKRAARHDAALFALATFLHLDTSGKEATETTEAEVAMLIAEDIAIWRPLLSAIKQTLGVDPMDLMVSDDNKPIHDYDAWARLMAEVAGTRWNEVFHDASPFAGRTLIYVKRRAVGAGRFILEGDGHAAAVRYVEALAESEGNRFVIESRDYKGGPVTSTVTVLALTKIK